LTRPPRPKPDLFGKAPPAPRDATPVTLPMREVGAGTDKAWHLAPMGVSSAKAAFVARALVSRGVGPQVNQFTMPRWLARERGWL
jgi:hypothetical protein